MGPTWPSRALVALALAFPFASIAAAEGVKPASSAPEAVAANVRQLRFGFGEFLPAASSTPYLLEVGADYTGRVSTTIGAQLLAHPHLPSGAHLEYLELDFCDNDPTNHILLALSECDVNGGNCNLINSITSPNLGATHCGTSVTTLVPQNYTVQNGTRQLYLYCYLNSGSNTNILTGAAVGYRLQASPAPATATFTDVPTTSPQFRFVEALFASGVTAGCAPSLYCPNDPITRGQMAVFLAAALGLNFAN